MSFNAAERKDVRRAEKDARIAERQRHEFMHSVMSTIPGRRWMLEKLEECHIFQTSYSREPITMAYMEGERSIGLKLLNDIMASCPDEYILMMRERNERSSAYNERTRSPSPDGGNQGSDLDDPSSGDDDSSASADASPYN